jgi:hypothetical protein
MVHLLVIVKFVMVRGGSFLFMIESLHTEWTRSLTTGGYNKSRV